MADKKILIVEDNAIIAMETVERLRRLGYSIGGITATGRDAIRLAASTGPDLILMDINLKGDMDGIEAARLIGENDPVPVIYLTAYSDEETFKKAMGGRPVRYLVKPYRERDLYMGIEEALGRLSRVTLPPQPTRMQQFIAGLDVFEDGIIVVSPTGDMMFLNRKAVEITGDGRFPF